jgi:hypothetical protein
VRIERAVSMRRRALWRSEGGHQNPTEGGILAVEACPHRRADQLWRTLTQLKEKLRSKTVWLPSLKTSAQSHSLSMSSSDRCACIICLAGRPLVIMLYCVGE